MVQLRTFEERTVLGDDVPWLTVPVPARLHIHDDGTREAVVDKDALEADVNPVGDADGLPLADAAYRPEAPGREGNRPLKRPKLSSCRAEPNPFVRAPCVRCGSALHGKGDCALFGRDRGASGAIADEPHKPSPPTDLGHDANPVGLRAADVLQIEVGPAVLYTALTTALRLLVGRSYASSVSRAEMRTWVRTNGSTRIAGHAVSDWVAWDSDLKWGIAEYVTWIGDAAVWAGPIECAAFAASRRVSVHVWRRAPTGDAYLRHAVFDPHDGPSAATVNLLHVHGRHYDVLVPRRRGER